jgi:MFS transporter, SP family, galactose:H+ symporter
MQFALIAVTAALGGLLFGYDTGVISSALLFIRTVFHLSSAGQSIVAGIVLVGAVIGAMVAGTLSDRFGRRLVILVTALTFVIGAVLSAAADSVAVLIVGRLLIGVAIGVASMLTPLYLAEIAPAASRGAVTSLNQLCITLGILVSYLIGYAFATTPEGWRWMLGLGAVPGAILALGMLVLPESPRWLAGHNRMPEAEAVLRRLRASPAEVADELATLRTDLRREGGRLVPWSALLAPSLRPALIIGIGLAMFQQITGINTVIYFAPQIFEAAGLSSASVSILATAGVGAVNVALTLVSIWLIDRAGRRALLLEPGRDGSYAADPGRRVCVWRLWCDGLAHGAVGCRLRRVLRGGPGAGVLVADRRDLPTRGAWTGDEPRDHLQLGFQSRGDGYVPGPDRPARPPRHVPAVRSADAGRADLHRRPGARNQGPQPGGNRG